MAKEELVRKIEKMEDKQLRQQADLVDAKIGRQNLDRSLRELQLSH